MIERKLATDLTGQRFGSWTVLQRDGVRNKFASFLCKCDCGRIKNVYGMYLRNGKSTKCSVKCDGKERAA